MRRLKSPRRVEKVMSQQQQRTWRRAVRFTAFVGVIASTFTMSSGSAVRAQAPAPTDVVCFPTCTANDGRFLVVAGNDPTTLGGVAVDVRLGAPLTSPTI